MTQHNPTKHAQTCITELRIAVNQLSECDTEQKVNEHYQNIKGIIKSIEFDIKDLKEDKIHEFECADYVPAF